MSEKVVRIKIHEEADLFSEFDPDQRMLSEDIIGYLVRCFQSMKAAHDDRRIIQICSDTPVDEEDVAEKIRNNFRREKDVVNRASNKLFLKALCLGVFGIIVLSIWFVLSADSENVNLEVLSIIGWVAVWEAASVLLIENQALLHSKKNMDKVINSRIVFQINEDCSK